MKSVKLNNGTAIPAIGFGTYRSTVDSGYQIVTDAIRAGYRHLDTASLYENEEDVGRAISESGIPREEFFLTSKLGRNFLGYEQTKAEFAASIEKLGVDYLDLYLIHWPRPDFGMSGFDDWKRLDIESWTAMEELCTEGKIRAIGVSNFLPHHLDNLLENGKVVPAVNQLELHPGYLQAETVDFCHKNGIAVEAWSPIGRARLMQHPLLVEIAEKYGVSVAHLCLAFDLQSGFIILPKSTHFERMQENLHPDDIVIAEEDMEAIREMPMAGWSGEHPDKERVEAQIG